MGPLSGYRVIDCTWGSSQLAGFVMAQLGAETVLARPRLSRHLDTQDPVTGSWDQLAEECYSRGKTTPDVALSIEEISELTAKADILITEGGPSNLGKQGFNRLEIQRKNPNLIWTAISPFGQTGPKANWNATDLVGLAAGGFLLLVGDDDRPPVRPSLPQAYAHAAADAAGAALIGLWHRSQSGHGQFIDVSVQASMLLATQSMVLADFYGAPSARRYGGGVCVPPLDIQLVWPCKDGIVTVTFMFGTSVGPYTARLMKWVHSEGFCEDELANLDWIRFSAQISSGEESLDTYERVKQRLGAFLKTKTKAELSKAALSRSLLIAPIATAEDVLGSVQLAERDYWSISSSEAFCGPIARLSETPLSAKDPLRVVSTFADIWSERNGSTSHPPQRPASDLEPEIYGESRGSLAGIKVLDFMWAMAGPAASRVLADHGATVVRIETASRIEAGRQLQPFFGNEIGIENSGVFLNMNAGKLGLALDLSTPEAREVVLDLVRWADVVCESFAPGTMDRWDLGYEQLRTVKPDIIMLATTLMGQTGSLKDFAGYGNLSAAICGFYNVTGWSDRLPTGPYVAYTDYVAPRMTLPILLAALDYRRRTGVGQFIDLSQAEASLHFLGPAVLRYSRSGLIPERVGNLDETYAPHGVFPCKGIEQWIAIVIRDSEEWQRLCNQVPDLREFRHLDHQDRRDRNNEIEGILSSWTVMRSRDSLEAELQGLGIPAHGLHASADSARDPQLRTRGHFATTKHALHGDVTVEACRWIFADSQPTSYCAAPTLGQHSYEVLSEILGYDDERIAALFGNDVVS